MAGFDVYDLMKRENETSLSMSRATVASYLKKAREIGVAKVTGLTGLTDHVGEFICKVSADRTVDFLVLGRRGMSRLKRLFVGSVTKYCFDHADCHVVVVKGEPGPEYEHDTTVAEIKALEEAERARRVEEYQRTERAQERLEFLNSSLNKNIAIMAEEAERQRRLNEESRASAAESSARQADLSAARAAEESERARRVAADAAITAAEHEASVKDLRNVKKMEEAERARRIAEGRTTAKLSQVVDEYLLEVQMVEMGLLQ